MANNFSELQKKVETSKNRVAVHVGDVWKEYPEHKERFKNFRKHDVGREGHSYRVAVQCNGRWIIYAWSFPKGKNGVVKKGRRLYVHDRKMWQILRDLKNKGDLKNYKIINKV